MLGIDIRITATQRAVILMAAMFLLGTWICPPARSAQPALAAKKETSDTAASLARPTPGQAAWHDMELGMFIHFGLWSWPQEEGIGLYAKRGVDDIQFFNPSELDTDQWVRVAESMGAKYIVITAKHGDGFCMWQTDTTDFSVKNTPWRDGRGDILADLSESCRRRGIKLGVYLNPRNAQRDVNDSGRAADPAKQAKEIDLIVVAGQSNCAGFDTVLEDLMPEPIDKEILFMFDVGGSPMYDNGFHNASSYAEWTTLRAQPNGVPYVKDGKIYKYAFRTKTGGFGPEISIARTLYDSGMRDLAVLKFAFASSCFARNHWNPGDGLNRAFMDRYRQAVEKLQEQGYTVRVKAVFWHQGESDTHNPNYPRQFMAFVNDLRSKWGNAKLPFITSVSTPDYWLWTGQVTDKERQERKLGVGAVHVEIAQKDPHIHYVDDRGCQRSKICGHYSSKGTLEIGSRMVKKYLEVYGSKK